MKARSPLVLRRKRTREEMPPYCLFLFCEIILLNLSRIFTLPEEIMLIILSYLNPFELAKARSGSSFEISNSYAFVVC